MVDKKDFSSGVCLLALGTYMAFKSSRMLIWSEFGPQEGFFPLLLGVIIMGLSLLVIVKSLGWRWVGGKEVKEKQEKNGVNIFKVSSYVILMLLYGVLIDRVGFVITSALLLILTLKFVEKQGWKITVLLGIGSVVVGYFLFVYLLKVPLPRGLFR